MKFAAHLRFTVFCAWIFAAVPVVAQTGSIQITVRITPSAGMAEPVRGFPIYLLSKSYADICKEAAASVPRPDMDQFIDGLTVSTKLKAWMKQHHTVTLTGDDFINSLTTDEILGIPEFRNAYLSRNAGDKIGGFPSPKYKESDRTKNPEKYKRAMDDYEAALRKYVVTNPQSKDGMDIGLDSIDPSHAWMDKIGAREPEIHRLALNLAQSKYHLAQTVTDDYGRAGFTGVAPGTYWLSSLGVEAHVSDTQETWDAPVTVQSGVTTQIDLSNFNAVPPASGANSHLRSRLAFPAIPHTLSSWLPRGSG
ncbi:MAG TPA: carboxypeptidase-like regulatory domain-containing protein [Candidatus Acidoferrales bacterium]|nr:carboxypeptidase-like regulatory domain-containing protein [Candidatus Acidoferrales bacterium]